MVAYDRNGMIWNYFRFYLTLLLDCVSEASVSRPYFAYQVLIDNRNRCTSLNNAYTFTVPLRPLRLTSLIHFQRNLKYLFYIIQQSMVCEPTITSYMYLQRVPGINSARVDLVCSIINY